MPFKDKIKIDVGIWSKKLIITEIFFSWFLTQEMFKMLSIRINGSI